MSDAHRLVAAVRARGAELRVRRGHVQIRRCERVPASLQSTVHERNAEVVRFLEAEAEAAEPDIVFQPRPGPKGWQAWSGKLPKGWTDASDTLPCVRCGFTTFARDTTGAPNHPYSCV